jgi:non-reducing end alpha-L-arabinofuranosidase
MCETNTDDNGNGHMDAVNLGTECYFSPCTGSGPWVEADMENGLFSGGNGSNTANAGNGTNFVTAMLKNNGQTTYALKGGDATTGGLSTWWEGALPDTGGYTPMHQEGAIVLGTGGDNSNWSVGTFFEGVMVSGYPSDATDNAVPANITSVGYSGASNGGTPPAGTIAGPGGRCVDVLGDDSGTDHAAVDLWNCQPTAIDQHWTHNSDDSLSTLGRCLDIVGNGTAVGTKVQLYDCDGVGGQVTR